MAHCAVYPAYQKLECPELNIEQMYAEHRDEVVFEPVIENELRFIFKSLFPRYIVIRIEVDS